jgi:DNA-binding GntR family transcriptional regulator
MPSGPQAVRLPSVKPLQRLSIIDRAELELRNALYTGELRSGDSLPEVHVASSMGISRSSLREACQRLVRDGLLTQHPGRGLFVTTFDARTSAAFLDYRLAIELQIVTRVCERVARERADGGQDAVDALLEPLHRQVEEVEKGMSAGHPIDAGNADLDLHFELAEICENPFLRTAMNTIVILTRMQAFADPRGYGVHEGLTAEHVELLEALHAADPDRARKDLGAMIHTVGEQSYDGHGQDVIRDPDLQTRREHDFPSITED